jgi:hypothetical protein
MYHLNMVNKQGERNMKALIMTLALVAVSAHAQLSPPMQYTGEIDRMTCTDGSGEVNQNCMAAQKEVRMRDEEAKLRADGKAMTPEQRAAVYQQFEQLMQEKK